MRQIFINILVLAICAWCATPDCAAKPVSITATADSTTLVMGDRVTVNVNVINEGAPGALVDPPQKKHDYFGLEMIEATTDTADLGNGRQEIAYRLIFQAFDPNELLTLPPFRYASGSDTVQSDILSFKVYPVELSPQLGDPNDVENLTIHPAEGPQTLPRKWYDVIPDWWIWVLVAVLVIALGFVLLRLYRKNGKTLFSKPKPVPPYELAMQRLSELKDRKLLEKGQTKVYYTDLIDIMRNYLDGRFGINAMEMPSTEILRRLRRNQETHLSATQIEDVLRLADIVKFAAANPSAQEGQSTFNTITKFLEDTKPVPQPEETPTTNKK